MFIEVKDVNDEPMMLNTDHLVSIQPVGKKCLVTLVGQSFPIHINMPYEILKRTMDYYVPVLKEAR